MLIQPNILPSIRTDLGNFESVFADYAKETAVGALLIPILSAPRISDAHHAWIDDLKRIEEREVNLGDGLDHFKQCGHLAYWLRRFAPVVDYQDIAKQYTGEDLYANERELRKLLEEYGTEYIAFDLGFQICEYYERERVDRKASVRDIPVDMEYLTTVCHMLKFKHVSPHAIFLIYKSLFI
jgi:hypothetical protein